MSGNLHCEVEVFENKGVSTGKVSDNINPCTISSRLILFILYRNSLCRPGYAGTYYRPAYPYNQHLQSILKRKVLRKTHFKRNKHTTVECGTVTQWITTQQ